MPAAILILELVGAAISEANDLIVLRKQLKQGLITEDQAMARLRATQQRYKAARDAWDAA